MIDELRERRLALGLTQRELSCFMSISPSILSNYETGKRIITPERLELYELILNMCETGEMKYHVHDLSKYPCKHYSFRRCVSYTKAIQTRPVRTALGLSLQNMSRLINVATASLSAKERGKYTMTVSEYSKLMKFYRSEKLKRIFGGMMS